MLKSHIFVYDFIVYKLDNCVIAMANCSCWVPPKIADKFFSEVFYCLISPDVYRMKMPVVEFLKYGVWLLAKSVSCICFPSNGRGRFC